MKKADTVGSSTPKSGIIKVKEIGPNTKPITNPEEKKKTANSSRSSSDWGFFEQNSTNFPKLKAPCKIKSNELSKQKVECNSFAPFR